MHTQLQQHIMRFSHQKALAQTGRRAKGGVEKRDASVLSFVIQQHHRMPVGGLMIPKFGADEADILLKVADSVVR